MQIHEAEQIKSHDQGAYVSTSGRMRQGVQRWTAEQGKYPDSGVHGTNACPTRQYIDHMIGRTLVRVEVSPESQGAPPFSPDEVTGLTHFDIVLRFQPIRSDPLDSARGIE